MVGFSPAVLSSRSACSRVKDLDGRPGWPFGRSHNKATSHLTTHVVRQWAPSPQPRWGAGLRRVVPSCRRPSARRERTGFECQRSSATYAAHRQTAGARGRDQDHSSRVRRGRARRRGLMWRPVAEPLPSRGRTSQPFLRRVACGGPTVLGEEVTLSIGPLLKSRCSTLTDAVGLAAPFDQERIHGRLGAV
jgi:hypothetical protein